ncbi:MAG: hypothetical protein EOP87_25130, partial [Verrucomicrobiaceae bacterium]
MKIQSLILLLALVSGLRAQNAPAADPYVKESQSTDAASRPAGHPNISVCYETFSLPLALAAKLRRDRTSDAELYARLGTAAGKDGIRQESFGIVRGLSAQKATTESVTEEIYPTEFVPPTMPGTLEVEVPLSSAAKPAEPADGTGGPPAPATPAAFDTRNVGNSMEVEATM